jgi:flagella basal body P-ring formation protein FlgA
MALFLRVQSMFKPRVKTSTPAKTMQMLCLVAVWGWAWMAWAATPAPQVAASGVDTVSTTRKGTSDAASASATPAEKMQAQVRQWMAQTSGGSPDEVQIAPMDNRLQVLPCERVLWIDHPFASRETVRVRCPAVAGSAAQNVNVTPLWQVYLRILSVGSGGSARSGAAASGPATKMVVVRQLQQRGTVLMPEMLQEVDAPAPVNGQVDATQLTSLQDATMAELVRDLPAGTPVRTHDIRRAVLVKMGQQVMMTVGNSADFQIRVRVEALQDGRMGEQVKLKNTESGRNMSGVVTGPNAVKGL